MKDAFETPKEQGLFGLKLSTNSKLPLAGQIYGGIREAIVAGRVVKGQRLPSSRSLAKDLGVARGTIVDAYQQLELEGYVRAERGSGTFVHGVPDDYQHVPSQPRPRRGNGSMPKPATRLLHQEAPLVYDDQARIPRPFQPGFPPLDAFPRQILARLASETFRSLSFNELAYGPPEGYLPLREALASYLRTARAVKCNPAQIFITNGAQHALALASHVLLDPGESVWVENPGSPGARAAFSKAGLRVVPVPVDEEGISIVHGKERAPEARAIFVTPSNQLPLGIPMSERRRFALLEWARSQGAWIIEDDYDSEYRYDSTPMPALQHFDVDGRVVYVGSFSKVLAPGLRLGYLVVPDSVVTTFRRARSSDDHHGSIIIEKVTAAFLQRGHYGRQLRRIRNIGAQRRDALIDACARHLPDHQLSATGGGLHAILHLKPRDDARLLAGRAAERGISLLPLAAFDIDGRGDQGLVLGYASYSEKEIASGVAVLREVLTVDS